VLFKGEKMSKSLGTVVDPLAAVEKFGPDPLRLYLTKEIVFGNDGDFSWDRFEEKYNADLANNLGNLVSRLTSMAGRYRQGRLVATAADPVLTEAFGGVATEWQAAHERLALDEACAAVFRWIDRLNEYIAVSAPWHLAKDADPAPLDRVLWNAAEGLRLAAVMLSPVIPASAREILRRLGEGAAIETWHTARVWRTSGDRQVTVKDALWPRLEPKKETDVTEPTPPATPTAPATPTTPEGTVAIPASQWPLDTRISIEDFLKIDLRVAKVLEAEKVPNSKKLMKLKIDLGSEQRTLVAGIAESYEAEQLVGRTVAIVANLKPAKLMGIESNGMILAASADGGKATLVAFEEAPAPGTRIK